MRDRALWTTTTMAQAMHAELQGALPPGVCGLSIDTRTIVPGDAFFAITGESRDGHDFVEAALTAHAGVAVVARQQRARFAPAAPLMIVEDVLEGLRNLARAARARSAAKICGITGSVGKTGTKEALRLALSRCADTHASAASYNNHWGVPLSLARMPASSRFGVFEMGMNHAGEIAPLAQLVRPDVAIVTAIEPVHLEYLGTMEHIADAKAEIFTGVVGGGAAVINGETPYFGRLRERAAAAGISEIVSFGMHSGADAQLLEVSLKPDCSIVSARILGAEVTYKLGAPGRHIVMNSLAVLAAASLLGADLAIAALALAGLEPPAGRGQRHILSFAGGNALLIDESYNANPASMRAALALLGQAEVSRGGRRIAVLGDMLELGPQSEALHRGLADAVLANTVDLVFCAGRQMRALWEALPSERRGEYAETAAALESSLLGAVRGGDAVMVKGSLGSRMGPIVTALRNRASDEARTGAQG